MSLLMLSFDVNGIGSPKVSFVCDCIIRASIWFYKMS